MKIEDSQVTKNEVPFVDLADFSEGKYSIAKISEKYPDLIVKETRTKWREGASSGKSPLNNHERIIEDTKLVVDNFGTFIPKTQLVKGKNEKGEIVIYTIQEKVVGKRLDELEYSEELAQQVRVFIDRMIDN